MSEEAKRLRLRAANELKRSRKTADEPLKAIHRARGAALKAMARNEEWLSGEPDRSALQSSAAVKLWTTTGSRTWD
jgi:hypothetical protein